MRYLIIDDHEVIRKGLKSVIHEEQRYQDTLVDEAGTIEQSHRLLNTHEYDLVLLDISLAGDSGLVILEYLQDEKPDLPVLIITMHPENQYAIRTLKMGAAGYLTKHSAAQDLIAAIEQIYTTGKYISPSVGLLLTEELAHAKRKNNQPHELLSNREMEIARLFATGASTSEIAHKLHLSIKTINTHRSRLLKKLGLKNIVQLANYFNQYRLM
jgi:DNA-binding NarL/FixJ family response regulator